jgi:hypothetical protein
MKNLKTKSLILFGLFIIIGFTRCSKDRLATKPVLNLYSSPDKFQNANKQPEETDTIKKGGTCPLTCRKGTTICIDSSLFNNAGGTAASYPFLLKVIELYSPKDMILYNMHSMAGSKALSTAAEIRMRAFAINGKDEYMVQPSKVCSIGTKAMPSTDPSMQIYYGVTLASPTDWTPTSTSGASGTMAVKSTTYQLLVPQTGWYNVAHPASYSGGSSTITFTSDKDDLTNVAKFIYFDKIKSLMRVNGTTSGDAPIGEHAIVICFAADASGKMFYYRQTLTIGSSNTIAVTMQAISEADLLAFLGAL